MAGVHHAYLGLFLALIGFVLVWVLPMLAFVLTVCGLAVFADDFYQHFLQRKEPEYQSPLHRIYCKYLWPIKWVQKLTMFFDRLFGL